MTAGPGGASRTTAGGPARWSARTPRHRGAAPGRGSTTKPMAAANSSQRSRRVRGSRPRYFMPATPRYVAAATTSPESSSSTAPWTSGRSSRSRPASEPAIDHGLGQDLRLPGRGHEHGRLDHVGPGRPSGPWVQQVMPGRPIGRVWPPVDARCPRWPRRHGRLAAGRRAGASPGRPPRNAGRRPRCPRPRRRQSRSAMSPSASTIAAGYRPAWPGHDRRSNPWPRHRGRNGSRARRTTRPPRGLTHEVPPGATRDPSGGHIAIESRIGLGRQTLVEQRHVHQVGAQVGRSLRPGEHGGERRSDRPCRASASALRRTGPDVSL